MTSRYRMTSGPTAPEPNLNQPVRIFVPTLTKTIFARVEIVISRDRFSINIH